MHYELMHKNIGVSTLDIDESVGNLNSLVSVVNHNHLPVGTFVNGFLDGTKLKQWWRERSIPKGRSGIRDVLEILGIPDTETLLAKSLGLSLSDQYWIRPFGSDLQWESVNFFDNGFSEQIGNLAFGKQIDVDNIDYSSPDITTDGMLRKGWKIIDGRRCLIKGGELPFMQEPFNEIIASKIMSALDIPHTEYSLLDVNGRTCSVCEDFVTRDTELVSAYHIMTSRKQRNDVNLYRHYVECCADLGIDIVPFLDRMLVLDYIIANGDRHMNNFGLIRDADTLEWLGPAPIFDSGSSLGHKLYANQIRTEAPISCKPFAKTFDDQLRFVSSFDWIDFDALDAAVDGCRELLDEVWDDTEPGRADAIVGLMRDQMSRLKCHRNA